MKPDADALHRAIADRRDDVVALTQALVRMPTPNPPGKDYKAVVEWLAGRLKKCGFEATIIRATGTPGDCDRYPRLNLIARRAGRHPGPTVHFNGHIDVVPAGNGWTTDPWGGSIRDGRIYGRGTADMKGGLAAAVVAAEALVALWPDHPGAIEISATADEETGGYGGVGFLAARGLFSPDRVDHVIIPEPLDKDRICLGHRGVWWARIETLGRIAHGSMPFLGECAIRHMGAVLSAMEAELLPALAARETAMPVAPAGARASTINFNGINGGQGEDFEGLPSPCVADSCRLVIDRRFPVEETLDGVKAETRALIERVAEARGFRFTLEDMLTVEPTLTPQEAPVARAVAESIAAVLGRAPSFIVSPGSYDQKHIVRHGNPGATVAYGPGRLELAHVPDEFVAIEDLVDSAHVMIRAAAALLQPAG